MTSRNLRRCVGGRRNIDPHRKRVHHLRQRGDESGRVRQLLPADARPDAKTGRRRRLLLRSRPPSCRRRQVRHFVFFNDFFFLAWYSQVEIFGWGAFFASQVERFF